MAVRHLQILVPSVTKDSALRIIEDLETIDSYSIEISEDRVLIDILVATESTEALVDSFERRFSALDAWRLSIETVDAMLPRPKKDEDHEEPSNQLDPSQDRKTRLRVSREELYTAVEGGLASLPRFLIMTALAALVAAIGLLRDDVAVIIGAMVLAPLLGPNVAFALATTLGDRELGREALRVGGLGFLLSLAIALFVGLVWEVDLSNTALLARTSFDLGSILLALASGTAGAFALCSGSASSLIGVMVAVALMPPLVTCGLALGEGHGQAALGALWLTLVNVICVNLAGVATFLLHGVGPRSFWEKDKARRASRRAMLLWALLLLGLASILLFSGGQSR